VKEQGLRVHPMSTPPNPPGKYTECDPEFPTRPTSSRFFLQNKKRPNDNFIDADITGMGYFHYNVRNDPKDGLGCPGTWLFEQAWMHFIRSGATILGIRGDWTFGNNLTTVNQLTANNHSKGYTTVNVLDTIGTPGNYTAVDVVYLQ